MKKASGPKEKDGSHVPSYIVTFSDMVTLLLTFFVMLLSLAEVQDPELFNKGRDSFWQSLRYCGLGPLLGRRTGLNLGDVKTRYPTSDPNNVSDTRGIDEQEETIRQIFERVKNSMTTMPSQIVADTLDFAVTNIHFLAGQSALNKQAELFLADFCLNLQQNLDPSDITLYVVGLAGDETTEKQQWILSARRAQAVAEFMQKTLSSGSTTYIPSYESQDWPIWRIFWWGAGPGGNWAGQDSRLPGQSHILIAVLKTVS